MRRHAAPAAAPARQYNARVVRQIAVVNTDPEMGARLYRRGIRQCIDVTYALTQRHTIWEYAPRSRAAEDYDAFVEFVAGGADTRVADPAEKSAKREAIL